MEEQLISFSTAKLAFEKGFTTKGIQLMGFTSKFYNSNTGSLLSFGRTGRTKLNESYYAPTQSLLQKWLREVHNIHINMSCLAVVNSVINDGSYSFSITTPVDKSNIKGLNYEEALEQGLYKALKLLK